ncbi:phage tail sheath subtilisin-like domain-containing protein [Peptostreptococcus faecalis]|uniref:phage tail sheath subtilisin-like domain-containing protein n=1 Tax=Peptostreptococcus faecalis TaxID=2045015 RepID=UPI000C7DCBE7|nr:phage tail sheath subtilisin-like domain-containing protein [Peptostreptococcus faecalis]
MAIGGGRFTGMNKPLAGAYINNISASRSLNLLGTNGVCAIAIEHNYGNKGEILEIESSNFADKCKSVLGYDLWDNKLKGLRELISNSVKTYIYILSDNTKAENKIAKAKFGGTRGNDISIKISPNVNDETKKEVITMIDNVAVDKQVVKSAEELESNKYVDFKEGITLADTTKTSLAGGTDGAVTLTDHQDFLNKIETYSFNALCCTSTDATFQELYIAYTKRMRDNVGLKFATIMKRLPKLTYDYEGIVTVLNDVVAGTGNELTYFTTALYANTELGKSNLNKKYNGEFEIIADYTQLELAEFINEGKFVYHRVGDEFRVLEDINSLVTFSEEKGEEFKENQVIRILDSLAMADANVFNSAYLGKVNIDKTGLESYEVDVIKIREEFLKLGAFRSYDKNSVVVEKVETVDGNKVRGVVRVNSVVTPAECFRQLYLTNVVK